MKHKLNNLYIFNINNLIFNISPRLSYSFMTQKYYIEIYTIISFKKETKQLQLYFNAGYGLYILLYTE